MVEMTRLRKGMQVEVLTAFGNWRNAVTVSEIEPTHMGGRKVHNFPVIWVKVYGADSERIPWPIESVRPAESRENSDGA